MGPRSQAGRDETVPHPVIGIAVRSWAGFRLLSPELLGPDGGDAGGRLVADDLPEQLLRTHRRSATARVLSGFLAAPAAGAAWPTPIHHPLLKRRRTAKRAERSSVEP